MCHKKNHLKRREGYLAILEMDSFNNSIDAWSERRSTGQSSHIGSCRITKIPRDILHIINGIEYCAVEITCDDATQYGIQAYGEELIQFHKEALRTYQLEKKEERTCHSPLIFPSDSQGVKINLTELPAELWAQPRVTS